MADIVRKALSHHDPNSFSNPEKIRVEHINLEWSIDFTRQVISGTAVYDLVAASENEPEVVMDVHSLTIKSIKDGNSGADLKFSIGEPYMTVGNPLRVETPKLKDLKGKIIIEYETSPKAEALQWMAKEQTHGKEFPYLYSQCQAIHARSLLPCQDTPFVKSTYSAKVRAPKDLTVLMSAVASGEPILDQDNSQKVFTFEQRVPIPSYLIAVVAGRLESAELGPRSRVWSEKPFLELAAIDFAETEEMLQIAENICGEYVWGRYDILVLPPSFPFGGMENPCLTFVTPTLLTGDKSLASVIAHEATHSWTGNLVTNKNFEHFWLNEGFTRFIERKIVGRLRGEAMRQFESHLGWSELTDALQQLGPTNPLTQLVVDLRGVDPEDAFSRVPYEKGYTFLYYLEEKVGGPAAFEPFLKVYIAEYAYKSIETDDFKKYFTDYFTKLGKSAEIADIDWNSWLFTPGLPVLKPNYDTSLLEPCVQLKERWDSWNPASGPSQFSPEDVSKLHPNQVVEFLNQLVASELPFSMQKAKEIEKIYSFTSSSNPEILFRWIRLICKAEWEEKLPFALEFVTKYGRMKFLQPIYRDLYKWEAVRPKAIETFQKNEPTMMRGSVFVTAKILGLRQ